MTYKEEINKKIQDKWKKGLVIGHDCIAFGDGRIVMGNTYSVIDSETKQRKRCWFPLCDTTLEGIEKYDDDIWTELQICDGSISYQNQTISFGYGAMGNEGFVVSLDKDKNLNWSLFFTFSNPIIKAELDENSLICSGDSGTIIEIDLQDLTQIKVRPEEA